MKIMKMKRYIIPMMAVAAVIGLGSCSQDTEPRYQPAAEFQLNTPAFATQYPRELCSLHARSPITVSRHRLNTLSAYR